MFEATRGGTRGGAGEFKWSDVKADKDRENYLGHSINAPQGRWQNSKDIHWYNRNKSDVTDEDAVKRQKARELREIKMREENELSIALGYGPVHDPDKIGLEEEPENDPAVKTEREIELEKLEAEEKQRRKELKREKKAMKEIEKKIKKQEKEERKLESRSLRSRRDRSRSRSRDRRDRSWSRERSRSPGRDRHRRRSIADDVLPPRDDTRDRQHGRREHAGEAVPGSRHEDLDRHPLRRSPTSERTRPADDPRVNPERRALLSRNNDRRPEAYDFEAERARDRQRWERYHDRERGLKEGDGWGKGGEGRPRDGGW